MTAPAPGFRYRTRIRYADVDMQGIMFSGAYLAYFDDALNAWFRACRFDVVGYARSTQYDIHIVRSLVEYKQPLTFDEEIEIGVRIDRIGTSSIRFLLEIYRLGSDVVTSTGEIVYVHADKALKRSAPIPDALRAQLLAPGER